MQVSQTIIDKGFTAIHEHGYERLKPLYEALNETLSYEQLHLLRILFLHEKK